MLVSLRTFFNLSLERLADNKIVQQGHVNSIIATSYPIIGLVFTNGMIRTSESFIYTYVVGKEASF